LSRSWNPYSKYTIHGERWAAGTLSHIQILSLRRPTTSENRRHRKASTLGAMVAPLQGIQGIQQTRPYPQKYHAAQCRYLLFHTFLEFSSIYKFIFYAYSAYRYRLLMLSRMLTFRSICHVQHEYFINFSCLTSLAVS
jgi:hypothetical protein